MTKNGELENYAIGGAIGAVFYVEPFSTKDIDVFVMMNSEATGLVTTIPGWRYLKELGYKETRGEAIVVEGWPVQFIPASNALEQEAYLNAVLLNFEDVPVRVVLAEHLVAIMLKTGRLKDLVRIQMFFAQEAVDPDILLDIIQRHGLENKWTNCLIKNLLESESLPQIRNLLEMSEINPARLRLKGGVENEADDEGTETDCGSDRGSLSQSWQEGEGSNSE